MFSDFELAERAKIKLKEPLGKLIELKELKPEDKIIAVGDRVALDLLEHKLEPRVMILDYKIKRKEIKGNERELLESFGNKALKASNPAGSITLDSWNKVKQALKSQEKIRLEIEGEEDLLALVCAFLAPKDYKILYGQPGEGIILMNHSEQAKQEYAELLICTKAREFLDKIKGKTLVLHHSDADGCCSATIILKYLEKRGVKAKPFFTNDPIIHPQLETHIEKEKPVNLILVDFGAEAEHSASELAQEMKVMILDHHKLVSNKSFGQALLLNPHMFEIPEERIAPASYLAYKTCELGDWLAAIGTISDKGFIACEQFLEEVKKTYTEDFNELKDLVNAADSVGEADKAVRRLLKAKKPSDLLESKSLNKFKSEIESELKKLLEKHKEKAKFYPEQKILFYKIKAEHSLRGTIANKLQKLYPEHIILIGEQEDDDFAMSFRTMKENTDIVKLIKLSIKDLKEARGGGHSKAAGAKVQLEDANTFIENFIKAVSKSK